MTPNRLAAMIDHTLLRPEARAADVVRVCDEALHFAFATVCVAPVWVPLAAGSLAAAATRTRVATVIGFPHGNTLPEVKAFEARRALEAGAQELDMVLQIGALKSGEDELALRDIRGVVSTARENSAVVKVIIETALLSDDEKVRACRLALEAGADYVKSSTGFAAAGATVQDVALMRRVVGERMGVKAAGGIKTLETALAMLDAGATRLGCSASVAIMRALHKSMGNGTSRAEE